MTSRRQQQRHLPARLVSMGLGVMIVTCITLLTATVGILLAGAHDHTVNDLTRSAAVGRRMAEQDAQAATPDLLRGIQSLIQRDVALYRGDRLAASAGFGGTAPPHALPAAIRHEVLDLGAGMDTAATLGGISYFLHYTPLGSPGHITGAVLVGQPADAVLHPALLAAELIILASVLIITLSGWVFARLAGGLAATIEASHTELRRANAWFENTIASMPHGLAVFDADGVLLVCNQRLNHLFGFAPDAMRPGVPLRDSTYAYRKLHGLSLDDVDQIAAKHLQALNSGRGWRQIAPGRDNGSVLTRHDPIPGGGWLLTVEDLVEQQDAASEIRFLKDFDRATHLPNRSYLLSRAQDLLDGLNVAAPEAGSAASRTWPVLLAIDLTRLKNLHDSFGQSVVDPLLNAVKERLQSCLAEADLLARVRVDEFAVLSPAIATAREATELAERLLAQINRRYDIGGRLLSIGATIGIALAPEHGTNAEQLLQNASIAMQVASGASGAWRMFEPEMEAILSDRLSLEADLGQALENGEFELFYQPLIDLKRDRISCLEALLRWHHPVRGTVSPVEFIPIAEQTGMIVKLGDWVINRACRDAADWPAHIRVAVNLSAIQLHDEVLVEVVQTALEASGLAPARLELEITESVLLEGDHASLRVLHRLRDLGTRISMDDFGTGHSSLSYLRDFPFDKIKIDKSFVQHMLVRSDCMAIVRTVTDLARSLGMAVTAEGAESLDQVERLRLEGCTEVQGFYYSRPKPLADMRLMMARDLAPAA